MPNEEKLLGAYRTAARELKRVVKQTDPRKPTVWIRKVVLVEIDEIMERLDAKTLDWLTIEIPKEYKKGSFQAISECKQQGLELKQTGFGQIHKEAIETLVEDAYLDFANSMEGVKRAGREFVSEIAKMKINERIIVGQIKGESLYTIKREIRKLVEKRGFTALVDRGGKRWKIDRYAEMLVRTHVIKANASGTRNRLLENKVDLVEISKHGGACGVCEGYEGGIFSLSGEDKRYGKAPELPIHPNCRHGFLPFVG
jgi:hypothetical protein